MATVDDIDTESAVRKFLERQVVSDREDPTADSADEITAILEAVALSFLLEPQAALAFVLLAKNNLQQLVQADLDLLDYLLKAVDDVSNPNELIDDTSDIVEAQTALLEVDRLGRVSSDVKAYDRYTAAVSRFLDRRLARSLKRRRKNEFERSGTEAKRDLFKCLSVQNGIHGLVATRLGLVAGSVSDFESVDLTRIVASKTVTRVRNSLKKVLQGIAQRTLSKTAMAIELLAGAASLKSISQIKKIYDPIIESEELPVGRDIFLRSEAVAAVASSADVLDLSGLTPPWEFDLVIDSEPPVTLTVGSGSPFVLGAILEDGLVDITGTKSLYVQFEGSPPTALPTDQAVLVREIALPAGLNQTVSSLASYLNTQLAPDATCADYGDRLLITAASGVTKMVVRSFYHGTYSGGGVYIPATESGHALLGFADDQESELDVFQPETLAAILNFQLDPVLVDASVENGIVVLRTVSTDPHSELVFDGEVATALGFSDAVSEPTYLELVEDIFALDPADFGIIPGTVVTVLDDVDGGLSFYQEPIASIDGTKLFFAEELLVPRCLAGNAVVTSPLVYAVQSLLDALRPFSSQSAFTKDVTDLQRVMSPLFSRPTLAQINDAKRVLERVRDNVQDLMAAISPIVVTRGANQFTDLMSNILLSLEERGLDRASELLRQASFSEFFSLSNLAASKSSRLMKAIEEVGRKDFPVTTVEEDQAEPQAKATTPDDDILPGEELSD